MIDNGNAPPPTTLRQCWSIFEGCVCRHHRDHDGYHECDVPNCMSFWTGEEASAARHDTSRDNHRNPQ